MAKVYKGPLTVVCPFVAQHITTIFLIDQALVTLILRFIDLCSFLFFLSSPSLSQSLSPTLIFLLPFLILHAVYFTGAG